MSLYRYSITKYTIVYNFVRYIARISAEFGTLDGSGLLPGGAHRKPFSAPRHLQCYRRPIYTGSAYGRSRAHR